MSYLQFVVWYVDQSKHFGAPSMEVAVRDAIALAERFKSDGLFNCH